MKKVMALFVLLEFSFMPSVSAGPTVALGVYRFGNCGGVQGDSVPGVDKEYQDRYLCESAYGQYGPGACHAVAELYAQEFIHDPQNFKRCEASIDRWEDECKRFVRQAAKQCASLKTTEELQEEENRSSQNEHTSAKDKFANATSANGLSTDETQRTSEQIKAENTAARRDKLKQAQLEEEREQQEFLARRQQAEYERQAEFAKQQAAANSDSSDNSTDETLSTIGSVLLGVAQGAAAAGNTGNTGIVLGGAVAALAGRALMESDHSKFEDNDSSTSYTGGMTSNHSQTNVGSSACIAAREHASQRVEAEGLTATGGGSAEAASKMKRMYQIILKEIRGVCPPAEVSAIQEAYNAAAKSECEFSTYCN